MMLSQKTIIPKFNDPLRDLMPLSESSECETNTNMKKQHSLEKWRVDLNFEKKQLEQRTNAKKTMTRKTLRRQGI